MTDSPAPPQPPSDDDDLTRTVLDTLGAAQGDGDAYTRLFERHFARILRATAMRLGISSQTCDADVEAAVQDVFLATFEKLREGRIQGIHTPGAFRRYVARAAKNRVIDELDRRKAIARGGGKVRRIGSLLGENSPSLLGLVAEDPAAIEQLARHSLEERLEQAILSLEEPYKSAIEMSYLFEMSPTEIAATGSLRQRSDQSQVSKPAAVRLILHRARGKLRKALGLPPENRAGNET